MANSFQIRREQWISEVTDLSVEDAVLVSARFPFVRLFGTWSQLRVNEQGLHVEIAPVKPSHPPTIVLRFDLPSEETTRYERRTNENGRTKLSVLYEPTNGNAAGWLDITDSLDLLFDADFAARPH